MFGRFRMHQKEAEQRSQDYLLPTAAPFRPVPRMDRMTEADLEDYLDHLCAPLIGTVSYPERQKFRQEARSQLEVVIAAHQELGSDREQAIARTLQSPAHAQADSVPTFFVGDSLGGRLQGPKRLALCSFGLASLIAWLILFATGEAINYSDRQWLFLPLVVALPLLAGAVVGKWAGANPYKSAGQALVWLSAPTLIAYLTWSHREEFTYPIQAGLHFACFHAAAWTLFANLGTALGTRIRKRSKRSGLTRRTRGRRQRSSVGSHAEPTAAPDANAPFAVGALRDPLPALRLGCSRR